MIVTITGKIGTGKTSLAKHFSEFGYNVIDVDKLGHKLLNDELVKDNIRNEFGKDVFDGWKIDRKKLGEIVFNDKEMLDILNSIIHPQLKKSIMGEVVEDQINVIDAALYYELELDKITDKLIIVEATIKAIKDRLKDRYDAATVENIYKQQRVPEKCDYRVKSGDLSKIAKKIMDDINGK